MTIDPLLIGDWNDGSVFQKRIDSDGVYNVVDLPLGYELLSSGARLITHPPSGPETFIRTGGSGVGLVGVWEQTHNEPDGLYIEEWSLRVDGTFTIHWTLNGAFESEQFGTYVSTPVTLTKIERRVQIYTGSSDQIVWAPFWGPLDLGTYAVTPSGNAWTLTLGGATTNFHRV